MIPTDKPDFAEFDALCDLAIEDRLTDDQRLRLERLALESPQCLRRYVEHANQHAHLAWSAADPSMLASGKHVHANPEPTPEPKAEPQGPTRFPRRLAWWGVALAAAAALVLAVRTSVPDLLTPRPQPVATLTAGKALRWEGSTVPTEVGARLAPGRLRLADGLAKIVFDHGAEVTLEAPADLELISADRCVLHSGRLVAKVPPPAIGFLVITPTAELHDLGTEFGVSVSDSRSDVQVFDGIVDVRHPGSGRTERLTTGRSVRFGESAIDDFDPNAERPDGPDGAAREGQRVLHISTAAGRGKDGYVIPVATPVHRSDVLLLVKNSISAGSKFLRKAYVGFDLSPLAGLRVLDAQMSFTFSPTGMGFASEVPDAVFAVHGLIDESLEVWDEKSLNWENAPANRPGGDALDPAKTVKLGTFTIVQGELRGTRGIGGPALAEFLNRNTNASATFILVRETKGSGRNDLVHGFAGRRHPTLPPPTLKLTVAPR